MSLLTTATSVTYVGNGSNSAFAVPFRFLDNAHIVAVRTNADLSKTTLVEGVGYVLTGARAANGGTLTLTAPLPSGTTLTISRATPRTQAVSLLSQGSFAPSIHEDALDRLAMVLQEIGALTVPDAVTRAYLEQYVSALLTGGTAVQPLVWTGTGDDTNTPLPIAGAQVSDASTYLVTIDGVLQSPTDDYTIDLMGPVVRWAAPVPLGAAIRVRSFGYAKGAYQLRTPAGLAQTGSVYQGSGIPSNANGNNGDVYFRIDTPGSVNQRIYVKSAGAWTGIL